MLQLGLLGQSRTNPNMGDGPVVLNFSVPIWPSTPVPLGPCWLVATSFQAPSQRVSSYCNGVTVSYNNVTALFKKTQCHRIKLHRPTKTEHSCIAFTVLRKFNRAMTLNTLISAASPCTEYMEIALPQENNLRTQSDLAKISYWVMGREITTLC